MNDASIRVSDLPHLQPRPTKGSPPSLSRLRITQQGSVMLHPVCSAVKLGIAGKMEGIARACSATVDVPLNAGCCAFAGDRGFLVPELTESATRQEANEVRGSDHESYCSSSRTCEIGLRRATGKPYQSYIYLLERATRENGNSP